MEIKMRTACFCGSGGACVRKWVWLWRPCFLFFFATVSSGFALWDVMLPGLTFLLAGDGMQISRRVPRHGGGGVGGGGVCLWLEQTGAAGCGILCSVVRNVPTRDYKRAAWSREVGGGVWLKSFLQSPPLPHVCTKLSKCSDRLIHLNLLK